MNFLKNGMYVCMYIKMNCALCSMHCANCFLREGEVVASFVSAHRGKDIEETTFLSRTQRSSWPYCVTDIVKLLFAVINTINRENTVSCRTNCFCRRDHRKHKIGFRHFKLLTVHILLATLRRNGIRIKVVKLRFQIFSNFRLLINIYSARKTRPVKLLHLVQKFWILNRNIVFFC